MEIVEVSCPRSVDLKSIINIDEGTKSILQTVDIFDKILISQDIKHQSIFIKSQDDLNEDIKNDIKKMIEIFFKYIDRNIDNLTITIEKNKIDFLENKYNILAGILIGLNLYFNSALSNHELIYLAQQVDNLIGYYIICGYKKIDVHNKNYDFGDNKYKKYLLFYDIELDELYKLKAYVIDNNINYCKNGNIHFIAIKDKDVLRVPFTLKKDLKNVKFYECSNVNKIKILKKYI